MPEIKGAKMWDLIREFFAAFRSIVHVCSEEHYNEGYADYMEGVDVFENPFPKGSMAHTDWEIGWTACEDACWHDAIAEENKRED